MRLCAEITFQAAACGRRVGVGAAKSSKTQIGLSCLASVLPPLGSQGWASQGHAQSSFHTPAAFLFRLKTMLKIVIIRKKTSKAMRTLPFPDSRGSSRLSRQPQDSAVQVPSTCTDKEPPRLPRGKEASPHSWSHHVKMYCIKIGFQGLGAGAWSESQCHPRPAPHTLG